MRAQKIRPKYGVISMVKIQKAGYKAGLLAKVPYLTFLNSPEASLAW